MTTTHLVLRYAHIACGTITLLTGVAAMALPKGSRLHRLSGNVFFASMLVLAAAGIVLSIINVPNAGNIMGGSMAIYLVSTAWATMIRSPGKTGAFEICMALIGFGGAIAAATMGVLAMNAANGRFAGYPPLFYFIFGGVAAFATALDVRMIRRGGLTGSARTTRHLWRMSMAFFMATGSFFFGQPRFVPTFMKETGLFIVAGLLPLALMLYFLVKTRVWPLLRRARRAVAGLA
jgi:uncharacterized membrane protein